ncbi:MAG: hypothetical protein NC433_10685 [Clostridiales bacterium]|nr:hypothetical protein [Clostridiales bacterium]
MMKKIFLPGLICLVLLSGCSTNKDTGYTDVIPTKIEDTGSDINLPKESASDIRQTSPTEMHEPEQSAAAEEIAETESQTKTAQIPKIYEGEYTGNTISDPNYDCLEIQRNEDDTYRIQVKIPFLTKLYECTGYQSENIILFSTSEWGADKNVEGSISFDGDFATVTFTSGWYQTATTESSYQYHKTSDTSRMEDCPYVRPNYTSFTGEYCDSNDDPSLEIRLNDDGSYLIQISIFREIGYDACIGSLSGEKMSFTSDQRGGVSGSITLDNDLAVVKFEQIGYFENSKVTTYLFHKISDSPNIEEQLNGLEYLIGEYDYSSDYGIGKLIINKTAYGYDISDYESESSYRFLANSSNIDMIENNRIYIKYPEQVFSDDTVIFSYYILEYGTDGINVYYTKTAYEEGEFLYYAAKNE